MEDLAVLALDLDLVALNLAAPFPRAVPSVWVQAGSFPRAVPSLPS